MKKRLIGTLLMGALMVSSTSVFVSCKDYDDDINNIVATKADKTELQQAKQDLQNEISGLRSQLSEQEGKITTLTSDLESLSSSKADKATYVGKLYNLIDEIERAVAAEAGLNSRLGSAEETLISINQALAGKVEQTEFDDSIKSIYAQLEAISTGLGGALSRVTSLEKDSMAAVRAVLADYKQQLTTLNNFKADFDANYKSKITDAYNKANEIYADYLKSSDKQELLNKINSNYNTLYTRIDSLKNEVNKSIGALNDSIAAHRLSIDGLRADVNAHSAAITKINAELVTLNILLNNTLRGLVFRPESYLLGIEAMTIKAMATGYWHDGTSATIPAANAEKQEKRGYSESDNFAGYATAAGRNSHGTARYDSTGIFFILPSYACYHMNPSSADLSKVTKVAILDGDKDYLVKTRASEAGLSCDPSIANHDWTSEYGILKVKLNAKDITKIKDPIANKKVTVFATQLTLKDGDKDTTVTSDYAAVTYDSIKDLRLTHKSVGYQVMNTHCGKCQLATENNDKRSHLMATVAEAAHFAPQDSVMWNDSLDLSTLIETHYTSTLGGHKSFSADEMKAYGLSYKYELTAFIVGTNNTSESVQAALKDSLFRPQVPTRDGKQQAYGAPQNESTAGRTPIVRVSLMKDGKVLDYGYIRIKIALKREKAKEKTPVYISYVGPTYKYRDNYECTPVKSAYADSTTWSITQYDIYNMLFAEAADGSISREEFEQNYIISGDYALPEQYENSRDGSDLKQYNVVVSANNDTSFVEIAADKKVGTISSKNEYNAQNGQLTSVLKWYMTGEAAYKYFVDASTGTAKTTLGQDGIGAHGVAVKYVSKNKNKYPDFYVIFEAPAPDVKTNKPTGTVDFTGKKIDEYWFSLNSLEKNGTADSGEAEIHVNVYSPEDLRGIDRYAVKGVNVTDTLAFLIKSALTGGEARDIITVANDSTANKEWAADKLYLKFIFDASNNDKKYKGADGKTYVLSVKNDTILQAYEEGTPNVKQDIAYLQHDGTTIAPANAKDSINHQKIVYNKNSKFAEYLLNYKGRFERDANTLIAYIGVKARNNCKTLELTQSPFAVRFDRPVNVLPGQIRTIRDAGSTGRQIIELRELINLQDWRGVMFRQHEGIDYWNYYNIKAIRIAGVPDGETNISGYVYTDMNKANRENLEWVKLNAVTNDLILTYNPVVKPVPAYGEADSYGTIEYQNLSGSVGNFKLKFPIVIEYQWGLTHTTEITVEVLPTQSARK